MQASTVRLNSELQTMHGSCATECQSGRSTQPLLMPETWQSVMPVGPDCFTRLWVSSWSGRQSVSEACWHQQLARHLASATCTLRVSGQHCPVFNCEFAYAHCTEGYCCLHRTQMLTSHCYALLCRERLGYGLESSLLIPLDTRNSCPCDNIAVESANCAKSLSCTSSALHGH